MRKPALATTPIGSARKSLKPAKTLPITKTALPRAKRDWRQINLNLARRGDVTFLVDFTKLATRPEGKLAGRGRPYDDTMINLAVAVISVYRLPLRQAEAFTGMLFKMMGLVVDVPDYSTISRRRRELAFNFMPHKTNSKVLIIDATGITVRSSGRWIEKWGLTSRKSMFVKLHVAVDQQTGRLRSYQITQAAGAGSADALSDPHL